MCGIAGIFSQQSGSAPPRAALESMQAVLRHRGPDESGIWADGPVGFAHTRLRIIDLVGGQQPLSDESGAVTLAYNGEIWNYVQLRDELRGRGQVFTSDSDTEVVLRAYIQYGEAFLSHVDGMFALAIWDRRSHQLVLARDRLGKKPLYYAQTPAGDLVFSSEIKALLCHPEIKAALDPQALADFLVLRYVPAPATMFAGICKLLPASFLAAGSRGMRQQTYWTLPLIGQEQVPPTQPELQALVRQRIQEAVQTRLMSDVPLGALLSGGIDSSVIVAAASRLMTQPLKTFSVRFADAPAAFDETPYARYVARRFATEHHEIDVGEREMLEALPAVTWHRDEPMTEPSEVPTYLMCRAAKPHATVLLSGEGGDELFAGYPKDAYDWLSQYTQPLPAWLRRAAGAGVHRAPQRFRRLKVAARSVLEPDEARRWATWFGAFSESEKATLLTESFARQVTEGDASRVFGQRLSGAPPADSLSRMLYMDMAVWLPDNLLMKGDKMSMAASVETRMPFLDRRLLDLAASIPSRKRVRPFVSKYLLKEAYVGVFPREFLYRRKVGFQVPIGAWLRAPRFGFLRDVLTGERARARGIFRPEAVEALVQEHARGVANHQAKLFVLLAVELWHRTYVDRNFSEAPAWSDLLDDAGERGHERSVAPSATLLV